MTQLEGDQTSTLVLNDSYSLEHTPTWAVGLVCVVFVALSLLMQRGLQKFGIWLVKRHQKPLNEALTKVKEELMLLGYISLLLTAAQNPISRLCMPEHWADHMLPCHFDQNTEIFNETPVPQPLTAYTTPLSSGPVGPMPVPHHIRALLIDRKTLPAAASSPNMRMVAREKLSSEVDEFLTKRDYHGRILSEISTHHFCSAGHVPILSTESLHQLHIFIFVMAVVHVFYSCWTMLMGFTQLRSWKKWEEETCVDNYNYTAEIRKSLNESSFMKIALRRQNTFIASRTSAAWSTTFTGSWINSFFRQFGRSVTKADYLSLRLGFIKNHNASMRLNFYKYMMRSLEDDLKTVIGISGYLWIFVIFFMILNVHGWYTYFWMSFIPVVINVVIGTKLQHIITQLAMETAHSHGVCDAPVKPRDELFWFNSPHLLLYLIHFVLFQNAFELAFCIWLVTTFGFNSCFFNQHGFIITRVIVGILAQVLCSYSTLPLYGLVSQMGSHYKKAIFDLPVSNAIQIWRSKAKESRRKRHEMNKSDHDHHKGFENLHLDLHSLSSDGTSHHNSNSGHPDPDHEDDHDHSSQHDDQSTHHGILHGRKVYLHPESPRTCKTPKTPRTPKSTKYNLKSTPHSAAAAITSGGAESESLSVEQCAAVNPEKKEESDVKEETFEAHSPALLSSWPGRPMARTLSFNLPNEGCIVGRDFLVNIADRIARLPSRKINLMITDDTIHRSRLEVPSSSPSLPPTPKPPAAGLPGSFAKPPAPKQRPATSSDTSASAVLNSPTTDSDESHATNDHDEIEKFNIPATIAEAAQGCSALEDTVYAPKDQL